MKRFILVVLFVSIVLVGADILEEQYKIPRDFILSTGVCSLGIGFLFSYLARPRYKQEKDTIVPPSFDFRAGEPEEDFVSSL